MKAALIVVASVLVLAVAGVAVLHLVGASRLDDAKEPLVVLAAWEIKPALEQIAERYEAATGRRVDLRFGTSRTLLAQLKLSEEGDLFICASEREQARAVEEGLVSWWSKRPLAYLVPAMLVQHGSPIEYLSDVVSEYATLVIPDPELEPMGRFAVEIIEAVPEMGDFAGEARELVCAMPPSTPEAVELVSLGRADVVIAWGIMQQWEPDFLDVVNLDPEEITRVGLVTIGKTQFCHNDEAASDFYRFLFEEEAQGILAKWRYITTEAEAVRAAPEAVIGGEPEVPDRWRHGRQNNLGEVDE